jgi:hypothetical protein
LVESGQEAHHLTLSVVIPEVTEDLFLLGVVLSYPLWLRP